MELNSLQALHGYAAAKGTASEKEPSLQAFSGVVRDFGQTLTDAETTAMNAMTNGADPHALVEALANTQLAVETAVTVRDRVVEAYQEILRMPV